MHGYLKSLIFFASGVLFAQPLEFAAAPIDNPLKGLVPYASSGKEGERFPHSMVFQYFGLNELMKGWGDYDWSILEKSLEKAKSSGRQLIFRVYLEYPGKEEGLPGFLPKEGVKVSYWQNKEGQKMITPDYENRILRRAMREFISAMGRKYDGDPRVGFITAGMLGMWGEWHNYPREDLQASTVVQKEVMTAYAESFRKTHVLLRYPAGVNDRWYADNRTVKMGYHDDSFAWSTIARPGEMDGWFFVPKLKKAGAANKWKTVPMGGEIRPEIWSTVFTDQVTGQEQDFRKCVEETHVSWLMDSGMFSERFEVDGARRKRAMKEVGRMGYELYISNVGVVKGQLEVTVENRGVAPFYYDWPVELRLGKMSQTNWKLTEVLPGKPVVWKVPILGEGEISIRVPNPMTGGRALKFANKGYRDGWLKLR